MELPGSLITLAERLRTGDVTSEVLVAGCLDRISTLNPIINAFSQIYAEEALEAARSCDRERASGRRRGPLHGIPVGVKDLFFTAGLTCERGSAAYRGFVPEATSPIVERTLAAGAIMIGKTTTTELGWSGSSASEFYGPTRNPWNPALTAGGSSSGSGAAVAAGMVPFALGSDGGGSVRIPAAFCGIFAMKGSLGRIPAWPWSATEMLSHAGPMTRSAADSALLFNILKGPDPRDHQALPDDGLDYRRPQTSARLRIGFAPTLFGVEVAPAIAATVRSAVDSLADGLAVNIDEVSPDWPDPISIFETLWVAGRGVAYGAQSDLSQFGSGFRQLVQASSHYSLADYLGAQKARAEFATRVHSWFEAYDLLLLPTLPVEPFPAELELPPGYNSNSAVLQWTGWTPFTYPFNISGNPAASLPCGTTFRGNPVGLQIVGRRHADAAVMAFAQAAERCLGFPDRYPPLVMAGGEVEVAATSPAEG